jgi:hypothetical protein
MQNLVTVKDIKIPSKRVSLITEICDKVITDNHKSNDRDYSYIHPSAVAGCTRKIMYDHFSYTPAQQPETHSLRVFDNGHAVHQRLQNYFEKAHIQIKDELVLNVPQYNISGRTDSLIQVNDEYLLIEIKSANAKSFKFTEYKNCPSESHAFQLQLYMHLANKLYPEYKIKRGMVMYECKDNHKWLEFETPYVPELYDRIIERLEYINHLMYTKTLPPIEYDKKEKFPCSWETGRCNYYNYCHN